MSLAASGQEGKPLSLRFDGIPNELRERPQWLAWRSERRNGKLTKIPYAIDGKRARTTDPQTWTTLEQAVQAYRNNTYDGIGFVFAPDDGLCGIDLDKCRDAETGTIDPAAQTVIERLDSYTETSPSGTGVHVLVRATKPGKRCRKPGIEVYDRGRYFCVTGQHVEGTPNTIEGRQDALDALYRDTFEEGPSVVNTPETGPVLPEEDDERLIERAMNSANGAKFRRLWNGDASGYRSDSEADLALCSMLAFRVGNDAGRIDRLFRASGLYREKWERRDYRDATIRAALNGVAQANPSPPRQGPDREFAWTDTGNAERLVAAHGDDFRFRSGKGGDSDSGTWFVWTGSRWEQDYTYRIALMGKQTARAMYGEAARIDDEDMRKKFVEFVRRSENQHRRAAMLALAKREPGVSVPPTSFDTDIWLLNCRNGTIDLRTGKLREHRREDMITRLAPVEYHVDAACPRFEGFLREIMLGNDLLVSWLVRYLGMCLSGDISEQLFPVFHGQGQNGKNTLLDTVKFVMGHYAGDAPPELCMVRQHSEHPTEIADLQGKRLVIASETEERRTLRLQLVKRMTGDATLKGRRMREDFVEFQRTHKTILVTNNKPVIREGKLATWRRVRLVPFNFCVPDDKVDKSLPATLRQEAPGILRLLVQGCRDWQREGLPNVPEIELATATYRKEQDVLGAFIEECCIASPTAKVSRPAIWKAYVSWADRTKERFPLSRNELYERLRERGYAECDFRKDGKPQRGFGGIALVNSEAEEA